MVVQAMEDASPSKWHLAHVTWFFETFVLARFLPGYRLFDERLPFCFNSYYESQGARQPRAHRGLLTRPSIDEVFGYRAHVDDALARLTDSDDIDPEAGRLIELGINHEQQHQELLLIDILSLFAENPFAPLIAIREHRHGATQATAHQLAGSNFPAAFFPWATTAMVSRGTMKDRATTRSCARFCSPTGWSRIASGWNSWPTAVIARHCSGSRTDGRL